MQNKQLSQTTINKIYNYLLNEYGVDTATNFDEAEDKAAFLVRNRETLETDPKWNRNFKIEDLLKSNKSAMESIYNTYSNIDDITPERMTQLTNAYDISKEDLKKYYNMREEQTKAVQKYNEDRWAEIDKARNEAQRADAKSYYNTPIANEYARKAYIQGDIDNAKWHEAAGKIAGAADFAPFPLSLAGPMIRQYQRYDIGEEKPSYIPSTETLLDYGSAVIPDIAERPAKLGLRYAKGALERIFNKAGDTKLFKQLENIASAKDDKLVTKAAARDKAIIEELGDMNKYTTEELLKFANSTDNPTIKNEIYKFIDARHSGQPLPTSIDLQMKELPSIELKANQPEVPVFNNGSVDLRYQPVNASQLAEYQALQDKGGIIANLLETGLNLSTRKFARSGIRGDVVPSTWYEYKPDYNEDKVIDELKRTYGPTFSINERPNTNDPLINKAYDEWYKDNQYNWDILNKLEVNKPKHRYPWER